MYSSTEVEGTKQELARTFLCKNLEGGSYETRSSDEQRGTKRKKGSVSSLLDKFENNKRPNKSTNLSTDKPKSHSIINKLSENNKRSRTPDQTKRSQTECPSQSTNLSTDTPKFLSIINKLSEINPELTTTSRAKPSNAKPSPTPEPTPKPSLSQQPNKATKPNIPQPKPNPPKKTQPPVGKPKKSMVEDPNQTKLDKYFKKQNQVPETQNQQQQTIGKIKPTLQKAKLNLPLPHPQQVEPNLKTKPPETQEKRPNPPKSEQPCTSPIAGQPPPPKKFVKPNIRKATLLLEPTPPQKPNQIGCTQVEQNPTSYPVDQISDKTKPSEFIKQKAESRTDPSKLKADPKKAVVKKKVLPDIKKFLSLKKSEIAERKLAVNIIPEPIPRSGPDLPIPVSREKTNISGWVPVEEKSEHSKGVKKCGK